MTLVPLKVHIKMVMPSSLGLASGSMTQINGSQSNVEQNRDIARVMKAALISDKKEECRWKISCL